MAASNPENALPVLVNPAHLRGKPSSASQKTSRGDPVVEAALRHIRQAQHAPAREILQRLLDRNPAHAEAHHLLGVIALQEGKALQAVEFLQRAVSLKPDHAIACSNLGFALSQLQRDEEALVHYDRALQHNSRFLDAHVNRGVTLNKLGRHEEAITAIDRAIVIKPDHADAYSNRGIALNNLNRFGEAAASYEAALELQPDSAAAHINLSNVQLLTGDFACGFEHFSWRWKATVPRLGGAQPFWLGTDAQRGRHDLPHGVPCAINLPFWDGTPTTASLLIWPEKGLGEQLMFASILEEARARVEGITLILDAKLHELFRYSFPEIRVVTLAQAQQTANYDLQLPFGDLCRLFRRSESDFLSQRKPYLRADPARVTGLRAAIPASARRRCGLGWFSKNALIGGHKSLDYTALKALLCSSQGWQFIDLQYGDTAGVRDMIRRDTGVEVVREDSVDNFNDIAGLAALIETCEIVVTVSTATAHLAGALGKTVFLMLPYAQGRFWYWQADREDSIWYPGMHIFRQTRPGEWGDVVERVSAALAHQAGSGMLP